MPRNSFRVKGLSKSASGAIPRKELREDARAFKKEIILNTAVEIFYRSGYQSATVDDVAAAVSVTKTAVYYYFESKEALLQAIIGRCSDLTVSAVERGIAAGATPPEKLALACFCFASMVLENQKMIAVYFREERCFPPNLHERVMSTERDVTSKLSRVIDTGVRRGEFRECNSQLLALRITGMISMAFYWYSEHGRVPKGELCKQFAADALLLAGFNDDYSMEQWLSALRS